ncbi:hypothetical protein IW492_04865 [Enterococcus sp. BWB1-3]|uniref:hypothetical protein n=1 Tax=unclassified Enterococcus TaxID=2608891 RepID=UPI001922F6D2|nr:MULTISPECIES: hypothetical protein [unclassified Enterococcus]MBL1228564.1 hypothetical protein [Enterococcus sp. BWB1-3]MCB5950569.1 hypothetical protein [Enterococcus sp. BWT-B8]MCB5955894.1 hypothetical protein [Enterococcus sp. CWB-B31]
MFENRALQQQIFDIEDQIRKKEQDLNDLYHLKKQHTAQMDDISWNFYERNRRIEQVSSDAFDLNFYRGYREFMGKLILESKKYYQKSEEEHLAITRIIYQLEQEITDLKQQRIRNESQLFSLTNLMKLERAEGYG